MTSSAIPAERRAAIQRELDTHQFVRTPELAQQLGTSVETLRRDLASLESQGVLLRVRGGAVSPAAHVDEGPYDQREHKHTKEKSAIGQASARLAENDATVFIDVGTTALEVARRLPQDFRGLIVTNSVQVSTIASARLDCDVFLLGGMVRKGDLAVSGTRAIEALKDFCPDIAFLGSGGLSARSGLVDFHYAEATLRRAVIHHTRHAWALVDSSKFERLAPYKVCDLQSLAGVVSDAEPPEQLSDALDAAETRLLVAKPQ